MANVKTLRDIFSMSPSERKAAYQANGLDGADGTIAKNIDKVVIDGNTFTDFSAFTFLMEKSYVKSPVRSSNGSIDNLDSYAWFLTPHLKMDFGLMSIDSYRTIMKLIQSKNEFTVTCYDVVNDKDVTHNMYFATEQMPKLWAIAKALNGDEWVELLGVQDYTVELIGTNTSTSLLSIVYHSNPPASSGLTDSSMGGESVAKGSEIIVGSGAESIVSTPPDGYKFKHWNDKADGTGAVYTNGNAITLNAELILYAIWEVTTNYTLNFSYGLSQPAVGTDYKQIFSKSVTYGSPIGELPTFDPNPSVDYKEQKYYPYSNGNWYRTAVKTPTSVPVKSDDIYNIEQDSTIYLLYDKSKYTLNYYLSGELYAADSVEYNAAISLPKLIRSGYTFDGWYSDSEYKTKFNGKMPPFGLNLYAKWIEV